MATLYSQPAAGTTNYAVPVTGWICVGLFYYQLSVQVKKPAQKPGDITAGATALGFGLLFVNQFSTRRLFREVVWSII